MKNLLLPILADDGTVLYRMESGTPAYVTFENPNPYNGTVGTAVDLGLPSGTLWADHNIGATNPEDYGDYYAWGETAAKETYNWTTYKWMNPAVNDLGGCTKYQFADGQTDCVWYDSEGNFIGDGKTELETSDDVASQTWGGKWQMPTRAMIKELTSQCYWVWTTTYNGKSVSGYIVYKAKTDTDKGAKVTSGSSPSSDYDVATDPHIFLPAERYRWGSELGDASYFGNYWSRSLDPDYSDCACSLYFDSALFWVSRYLDRCCGFAVRPVVLPAAE